MKRGITLIARLLVGSLMVVTLVACSTTRKALDFETSAVLNIKTTQDVNPTSQGKAAPIVLQVIKLRDARQFKQEDFLSLFEDPKNRLGNDLIEIIRLKELAPGESRIETLSLSPDVKYIGLLGEYIQYEQADAKVIIEIEPHTTNKREIVVEKLKIRLED